jgi:mono/diheme cytochrome c family protein
MAGQRTTVGTARGNGRMALLVVALLALPLTPASQYAAAQRAGDPDRGRELYHAHACYGCHGYNGETGARDLVGTGSPLIADVDVFIAYLRGRADFLPLFPSTRMPSYSAAALADADARDIFAYIQTFELDEPAVEDAPALREILESAETEGG